jgi:hypothetical protein
MYIYIYIYIYMLLVWTSRRSGSNDHEAFLFELTVRLRSMRGKKAMKLVKGMAHEVGAKQSRGSQLLK